MEPPVPKQKKNFVKFLKQAEVCGLVPFHCLNSAVITAASVTTPSNEVTLVLKHRGSRYQPSPDSHPETQ